MGQAPKGLLQASEPKGLEHWPFRALTLEEVDKGKGTDEADEA